MGKEKSMRGTRCDGFKEKGSLIIVADVSEKQRTVHQIIP